MSPSVESPDPLQPMTVGNIVNTGFRLYTTNLQPYLKVAAIATLWAMLPWLALLPLVGFFAVIQSGYSLLALLIPAWFVLLAFCMAHYLAGSGAIARLAFTELTGTPETPKQSQRFTSRRKWSFLILSILVGLIFFGITLVMSLLGIIFVTALFAAMGGLDFLQNPEAAPFVNPTLFFASGLVILLVILVFLVMLYWLVVRFFIAEVPLAIEDGIGPAQSIGRSWELTQRGFWRILLVSLVTSILAFPLQAVVQVMANLIQDGITLVFPEESAIGLFLIGIVSLVLGLGFGILLLPLWQSMKAVIYYDQRTRREGLDLQLRDWGDRTPPTDS